MLLPLQSKLFPRQVQDPLQLTLSSAESIIELRSNERLRQQQLNELEQYLNVSSPVEDDLVATEDARLSGTCKWFTAKESYQQWTDHAQKVPSLLCVIGKPGAGKTVLAGYIINQLQKQNIDCSYFFFKHGDKFKSRLNFCLRSLAWQMASTSKHARETLLEMQKDGIKFDNDNERATWRKIFVCGIFQKSFSNHYWVIDGLDECVNPASFTESMLAKLDESIPLRILILTRESPELHRQLQNLGAHQLQQEMITAIDTSDDIKLVIEARAKSVLLKSDEERADLVKNVLQKAQGSFLWTVQVLHELSHAHGEGEIKLALETIPNGMGPLYQRTLETMTSSAGGKRLTKAVLTWVACGIRPLSKMELEGALEMDIEDSFPKLEESISALCGHLVTIDKFGKVQMVHETAREFLLNDDLKSEFAVRETEAHTQIVRACLKYLGGDEMRPPRTNRRGSARKILGERAAFSAYACAAFSYHLAKADPLSKDVLELTKKFFKLNVLSWIEVLTQTRSFVPLIRAANDIKTYLDSCVAERSPLDGSIQIIRGWSIDLIRIVAKFANALTTSPSAIYTLIPPFCPRESMVHKIVKSGRNLQVLGLSEIRWNDRLVCLDFHGGQTSALCHGEDFFAVGLFSGVIVLYNATSFQESKLLNHGEPVRILQFRSKTAIMASCGIKTIKVWDTGTGKMLHTFKAVQRFVGIAFDRSLLIAASSDNYLASWDLDHSGNPLSNSPWNDGSERSNTPSRLTPCAISIAVSHRMSAIAYSRRPITLWDLEEDTYYGNCGKKLADGRTSTHMVTVLLFNPNPNIELLAVSYLDGELAVLDPFTDKELAGLRANCNTLASSPDGRLLAGGGGGGSIQIYEFDTLNLLYRVTSASIHIKQLAFSPDGLRFSDIRGSHCNVWEPVDLLRNSIGDESSEDTSMTLVDVIATDTKVKVTTMASHTGGKFVFCGKGNGLVSLYELNTGTEVRTLYEHKSLVHTLAWWPQREYLMSIDVSNKMCLSTLKDSPKIGWGTVDMLFQSRLDCGSAIMQLLLGEAAGKFILSTRESAHLWCIDGRQEQVRTYPARAGFRKWVQHQQSPLHMMCIEGTVASIYAWSDWSEVGSVHLTVDIAGLQIKTVSPYIYISQPGILLEMSELDGPPDTRSLQLLDATSLDIKNIAASVTDSKAIRVGEGTDKVSIREEVSAVEATSRPLLGPPLAALASRVAHIIGFTKTDHILFLDSHSWVCSADLEEFNDYSVSYLRHFFVPYEWFAGTRNILCAVAQQDVIFARNDGVAVVKGGLEHGEKVIIEVEDTERRI